MDIYSILTNYITIDNLIEYGCIILTILVLWELRGNSYIRSCLSKPPEVYNKYIDKIVEEVKDENRRSNPRED
jgi:hypothetical protein